MNKSSILKLSIFAAVLTLASTSTLHAQAPDGRVEIKVPFAFEVGPAHFAPGLYTISMLNRSTLYVHGPKSGVFASIEPGSGNSAIAGGKVVFHRVGDQYFLSQVWSDGNKLPLVVNPSKAEKEALSQLAANHPAMQGTEVILAQATK